MNTDQAAPIRAAGVMFLTKDRQALFMRRGDGSFDPGCWAFPGGTWEAGETIEQTALRECEEETGVKLKAKDVKLHTRRIANAEMANGAHSDELPMPPIEGGPPENAVVVPGVLVDFTTFLARVPEPFIPAMCDEHTAWAWADIDKPPEPLHPGCRVAIDRLDMDELGVARAMAAGELTSPQQYLNMHLWCIRITGTGVAYRTSIGEFVLRKPEYYLTDEAMARVNGLSVILEHPLKATMDSKEYGARVMGAIMLPFVKDNELWGVARIYDDAVNQAMIDDEVSTSPTVFFRDPKKSLKMTLEDGKKLLIEQAPDLIDHIALLPKAAGVWDKLGPLSGVDRSGVVSPAPSELKAIADALVLTDFKISALASRRRA